MVAFIGSCLVAALGIGAIVAYGLRRPVGAPLSWGEAMASATFIFFLMFWCYGVVPDRWLIFANNDWGWTPTKIFLEEGKWEVAGIPIPPFVIDYEKVRDLIVVVIYGIFIGVQIGLWAWWNDRSKRAETKRQRELEPSTYGRPLVKQG